MKNVAILFLILLWCCTCTASAIDSLRKIIVGRNNVTQSARDTLYVNALNELAMIYLERAEDSTLYFSQKALNASQKINYEKGMAEAFRCMGNYHYLKADFYTAIEDYQHSLTIAEAIQEERIIAFVSYNLSLSYNAIGLNLQAIPSSYQAIASYEKLISRFPEDRKENQKCLVHVYNNLAKSYMDQVQYDSAFKFLNKSLSLSLALSYSYGIMLNQNNMGVVYQFQGKYDKAISLIKTSLNRAVAERFDYMIAHYLWALGKVYASKGWPTNAMVYTRGAFLISKAIEDKSSLALFGNQIAFLFRNAQRYDSAAMYANASLSFARAVGSIPQCINSVRLLADICEDQRDYKKALLYERQFKSFSDSLSNDNKRMQLVSVEIAQKNNLVKKHFESEMAAGSLVRNEENFKHKIILIISIAGAAVLLIVILYVQRSSRKLATLNAQLKHAYRDIEESRDAVVRQNQELISHQEEIRAINNNLELIIAERTRKLRQRNFQLSEYAFFNAHKMRSPITTILGLFNLFKFCSHEEERIEIFNRMRIPVEELERLTHVSQKFLDQDFMTGKQE